MVVLAPDQTVDAEVIWQTIEIGYERDQHEYGREYAHREQHQCIGIRGKRIGIVGRDLVPEGVEPEPCLPRVVAGLVHHSPLRTQQVELCRFRWQRILRQEEQRLRKVILIEVAIVLEQAV